MIGRWRVEGLPNSIGRKEIFDATNWLMDADITPIQGTVVWVNGIFGWTEYKINYQTKKPILDKRTEKLLVTLVVMEMSEPYRRNHLDKWIIWEGQVKEGPQLLPSYAQGGYISGPPSKIRHIPGEFVFPRLSVQKSSILKYFDDKETEINEKLEKDRRYYEEILKIMRDPAYLGKSVEELPLQPPNTVRRGPSPTFSVVDECSDTPEPPKSPLRALEKEGERADEEAQSDKN